MKIKPLFDRVVLKQVQIEQNSTSGLVFPQSAQEKPLVGEVLEVGDGKTCDSNSQKMIVKKGDKVLFSKYAGNEFKLNQKEVIVIRQSDILAILED